MMSILSTSTEVSRTNKPESLSWLPKPIKNIMMAAGIGATSLIALPPANAAITITSTAPAPWTDGVGSNNVSQENSTTPGISYISTGYNVDKTFQSTMQSTLSAIDVGTFGGDLTVSGYEHFVASVGKPSTRIDMDGRFYCSIDGGPNIDISTLQTADQLNNNIASLNSVDGETPINSSNYFNKIIPLTPGAHTITWTHEVDSQNIRGNFYLSGDIAGTQAFNTSFEKNLVPETSASLLVAVALGGLTFIRRRDGTVEQAKTGSSNT